MRETIANISSYSDFRHLRQLINVIEMGMGNLRKCGMRNAECGK